MRAQFIKCLVKIIIKDRLSVMPLKFTFLYFSKHFATYRHTAGKPNLTRQHSRLLKPVTPLSFTHNYLNFLPFHSGDVEITLPHTLESIFVLYKQLPTHSRVTRSDKAVLEVTEICNPPMIFCFTQNYFIVQLIHSSDF